MSISFHPIGYECPKHHDSAKIVKVGDEVPKEIECEKYGCGLMAQIKRQDHRIVGRGIQLIFQPYAFAEHGFCGPSDRLAYCKDDVNTIDFVPGQKNKGPRTYMEFKGGPGRSRFHKVY